MRRASLGIVILGIGLGGISGSFGQTQRGESRLEERLLRPEVKENHSLQARSFQTSSNLQTKRVKEDKAFRTGSASQTGSTYEAPTFLGLKVPWLAKKKMATEKFAGGDEKVALKRAELGERKSIEEKSFFASDRKTQTVKRAVPVERASMAGKAQRQIDEEYGRGQAPLSVEEVRELLNKPR